MSDAEQSVPTSPTFPPRIHVLLAREAPAGVVFRRGPSKMVCTLLWNLRSDRFQVGQWFKGRIYERRGDLSPDGRYMIYFAMKGERLRQACGSWTAISRAPYLKALMLYPKVDCWNGGGLFTGPNTYWLNDLPTAHPAIRSAAELQRDPKFRPRYDFGGECPGVYYPRLLRDGWNLLGRVKIHDWKRYHLFEKPVSHGWTLRKIARGELKHPEGRGCYWDEHELAHPGQERTLHFPGWEWAEWRDNRLLWAEAGKLWAGRVHEEGITDQKMLIDLTPMTFQPLQAPY